MLDDIRFKNIKDGKMGEFLSGLANLGEEIGMNVLSAALTPKGGNIWNTKRRLLGLSKKGYFDISVKNNKTFFRLTAKGMRLAELLKFCTGKVKWDKRWRVLIFDIPEKQKSKREALRIKLAVLGFSQLQESVWITPFPLPDEFSDFLSNLRVRPYLYSLTVEAINREDELKRIFGLN